MKPFTKIKNMVEGVDGLDFGCDDGGESGPDLNYAVSRAWEMGLAWGFRSGSFSLRGEPGRLHA